MISPGSIKSNDTLPLLSEIHLDNSKKHHINPFNKNNHNQNFNPVRDQNLHDTLSGGGGKVSESS